jgi:uncharacterized protein (TIGR02596 family)
MVWTVLQRFSEATLGRMALPLRSTLRQIALCLFYVSRYIIFFVQRCLEAAAEEFPQMSEQLDNPPLCGELKSRPRVTVAHRRGQAFTLLEMLVVMAIIVMLAALLVPSSVGIMKGMSLTQGGQMVRDQLSYARQTALSRNLPVEVRFYQYGDPLIPGESASNPTSGKYRAVQLFQIMESGSAAKPLGKIQRLPDTIIVDSGTTLSSIIGDLTRTSGTGSSTGAVLNTPIPRVGTSYNCVSFRFQPDGSTNLPRNANWFLSLHYASVGDTLSVTGGTLPSFITLQVDPANGHVKIYRPGI